MKWDQQANDLKVDLEKLNNFNVAASNVGKIVITVKDSGAGMSAENLGKLFLEGMQFNANKLQGGKGSGLGLFITRGIVNLHNGSIKAFSEGEDKGSTFILQYPVVEIDIPLNSTIDIESRIELKKDDTHITRQKCTGDNTLPSFKNIILELNKNPNRIKNILVVDDSSPSRKMVIRLLTNSGFICSQAEDGQLCVNYMIENVVGPVEDKIDLILMDFEMPVMNGPDAVKALRALGITLPIIGLTGNVLPADRSIFLDSGANDVLTKPLNLSQLGAILIDLSINIPPPPLIEASTNVATEVSEKVRYMLFY